MVSPQQQMEPADYKSETDPTWCPGCGDFGLLSATQGALSELGLVPHEVAIISGIGCSSNFPHFLDTYGMHTLHGRLLPVATGVKMANPELTVIGTGGDGDGYAIGSGHFTHACRRNLDMTYLVMDNQIYGLTTGQTSPTSQEGHETKSTPEGNIEPPYNPLGVALAEGATYVARGFAGDPKNLQALIVGAIQHDGFAFVDTFTPCVTFNKVNTYQWFQEKIYNVNDPPEDLDVEPLDTSDKTAAFERAMELDRLGYGLFHQTEGKPSYDGRDPTLSRDVHPVEDIQARDVTELLEAFE